MKLNQLKDNEVPIVISIIKKCHRYNNGERIKRNEKPLSHYIYNYQFSINKAKEYMDQNLISFTDEENNLILELFNTKYKQNNVDNRQVM